MDNKVVIAVAIVAVVLVAGIAAVVIVNNGNGSTTSDKSLDCKMRVLGNANMDNYLNDDDVKCLEQYVKDIESGKKIWNRVDEPLVDANDDGIINNEDVALVKKFVNGQSATMYYLDQDGTVRHVPYPLTGVLGTSYGICTEWSTGIDMAVILGIDDKIKYVANSDIDASNLDPALDPNISKYKSFGMKTPALDVMWADGVRIMMGDHPKGFGSYCDTAEALGFTIIKLPLNRAVNKVDSLDTLITLGAMYNLQDKTKPFIEFMEKVNAKIAAGHAAGATALSYIIPYCAPGYEAFYVDAHGSGPMTTADVTLLEKLPVTSKVTTTAADGFDEMTADQLVALNPDMFVVAMFAYASDKNVTVQQYQDAFKAWIQHGFDKSTAGKNGKLYAMPFETCTLAGYASILVLASKIWPNAYNEDEAWSLMQEYYDNFTNFKGDVKNSKFAPLVYSELNA
ncbi:MAG: hypothetical protein IJT54_05240 [Candidatus Methanomethylophilaceae archaeon]|nr:hypothetical protein [Candidatus Methanomethylophilaceae archaeon]